MIEEETKKILIVQSSGVREPKRTYAPLYIALAGAAMEMEVKVWFTMEGVSLLRKGAAEKIELSPGSGVTLKTWLNRALEAGVQLLACTQAMEGEGLAVDDLVDGCGMTGAAGMIELSFEADRVFFF
jgi:predicted peroxiredoxin